MARSAGFHDADAWKGKRDMGKRIENWEKARGKKRKKKEDKNKQKKEKEKKTGGKEGN